MSKPIKGLNVLCRHQPDMFNMILGNEEYKIAIEETEGEAEKLKDVFWNVLADDYHWEFINGEIVLRCGMIISDAVAKQNLQIQLWDFVKKCKAGEVFGSRCICDFNPDFFSPQIIYYENKRASDYYNEMKCFPVPDFIVEFNDENTEENNRGIKFEAYERKRVKEYWMVNVEAKTIEQYQLTKGIFDFTGLYKTGIIKSVAVKDFQLMIEEVFEM